MQKYSSAKTSINSKKTPAVFKKVVWEQNTINLDLGGGKFNTATEYLKNFNVTNVIYDPYNRSNDYNNTMKKFLEDFPANTVTISNVINVILEDEVIIDILHFAKNNSLPNAKIYITVYEGDGNGIGKETKAGYQRNMKLNDYLPLVQKVFPNATTKKGIIIAINS